MLRLDGYSLTPGEFLEVDAMAASVEAQFVSVVDEAFLLHPFANSHFRKQVDRALFQYACTNAFFDILTAAILNDDGFNPLQM